MICGNCGQELQGNEAFCGKCGAKVSGGSQSVLKFCSNCGKELNQNGRFCSNCGYDNTCESNSVTSPQSASACKPMMTFAEAIANCFVKKVISPQGRAPRAEFWWFNLLAFILAFIFSFLSTFFPAATLLYWGTNLLLLIPSIFVTIRRYHDLNKSGWYALLLLVPFIGLIIVAIMCCQKGTAGPNRYGEDPLV